MNIGYLTPRCDFSALLGLTLSELRVLADTEIHFRTTCGREFILAHLQDCCECVRIEEMHGDKTEDMIGSEITVAEEVVNPPEALCPQYAESYTWTFYRIACQNGANMQIRWLGESNGYYSESVDFVEVTP